MTDQNDGPDEEELIENLTVIQREIKGDKARLDTLYRKQALNEPGALSGELVQTLYPAVVDITEVITQLLTNHSEGLLGVEDAVYQQNTKAMQLLVTALVAKGALEQETATKVIEIIGNDDTTVESFLTSADSSLVLAQLQAYEQVLKEQANGEPSTPLKTLQQAIARVQEISEGTEEESDSDSESTEIETVETEGTEAEA